MPELDLEAQTGLLGCAPASLPSDDLVAPLFALAHEDGLQHADLPNRCCELRERLLVKAITAVIAADGKLTNVEADVMRAVCASLDVPLPPILTS